MILLEGQIKGYERARRERERERERDMEIEREKIGGKYQKMIITVNIFRI